MKSLFKKSPLMVIICVLTFMGATAMAGLRDRSSGIELYGDKDSAGNYLNIPEISAPTGNPDTNWGWLYVKDSGGASTLYFENDAGTVTDLITATTTATDFALTADADAGDYDIKSLDKLEFYDTGLYIDGGADGVLALVSDGTFAIDTADWDISTTGTITNASLSADQISAAALTLGNNYLSLGTDPADAGTIRMPNAGTIMFEADATGTDIEALSVDASEVVQIGASGASGVTITPNVTMSGTLSVVGTLYESAIAPSSGNLTVNASGAGTVSIGNSSTGAIIITGGGVDIGDGATDTLTITGIVDSDVTLDDGTTDSPKMIFKDSDDEQAEIYQDQASDDLEVECNDASDSLAVIVGNLSSGAPANDVITVNGGDLFVADDAEIDGTLAVDTDLDVNGTANISGATTQGGVLTLGANGLTLDGAVNNIFEWNETSEDLLWTFAATSIDMSSGSGILQLDFFDNVADAVFTHATDGAADDLHFTLTGATDSTLRVTSSGTGADALVVSTSAGGIDITVAGAAANEDIDISTNTSINLTASAETVADQIKLDAVGAIAGNAINVTTTNGGIIVDANGANGNLDIDGATSVDVLSATAVKLAGGGTVQIDSSDWDISTAGAATLMASVGFDSASVIHHTTITVSNAALKDLVANPHELIATPGASAFIELVSAVMYLDYPGTNVFTVGAADDLVIEYGTSNDDITGSIETTGWLDQAADQVVTYFPTSPQASNVMSDLVNNNVELFNTGVDIAGNAGNDNTLVIKLAYRVHPWS